MSSSNPVAVPRIPRRRLIQVGALGGLGLNLASTLSARAAGRASVRSCILIFYYGGPSQFETWDPKPEAPSEIRGEFQPIETSAPGIRISEHLPLTARVMHHAAIIRSVHHPMRNHNSAAVEALCGRTPLGGDQELLADDALAFPCHGAALGYALRSRPADLFSVALPHVMYNLVRLPGQTSGLLGPLYQPYQVLSDPNSANFSPGELDVPANFAHRLANREALLRTVDAQLDRSERLLTGHPAPPPLHRAFSLLRSEPVREAFRLQRENPRTRQRYGENTLGQSLLLSRRLVEAGVRFVTVYDKIHNGQEANWDSHEQVFVRSRDHLLPPADRSFSALIEDLSARGLLESTLVVAMAEFGRTPKINAAAGRDHWPDCFSIVLAGGGIRGGTIYGASDAHGAYPAADPVTPGDLAATLFQRFGVDPRTEVRDKSGRPFPLAEGTPLHRLF